MQKGAYWSRLDDRLVDWIAKALRRKPTAEPRVAAALRAAAPHSERLCTSLAQAAEVLIRRRSYDRRLYAASLRALADTQDLRAGALFDEALRCESSGGLPTLAAAAHFPSAAAGDLLARAAAARRPEIAFGAEVVRALRREARRAILMDAAARLKESARIELCTQLLAPILLLKSKPVELPATVAPAMDVLRRSERHLGRWLVFALGGVQGGDDTPLAEAAARSRQGSSSARTAWSLLSWALAARSALPDGSEASSSEPPRAKPTAEIVARLSDRPTAERDMSFLFRLADKRAESARAMLESISNKPLEHATAVRAASVLARGYESKQARGELRRAADGGGRAMLQGIAIAGLWDAGDENEARERAESLYDARQLSCAVWGGLVLRADRNRGADPIINERSFRYLERGWVE